MMPPSAVDWSLYLVVDPAQCAGDRSFLETTRDALDGGVGIVQLRDKQSDDRGLADCAQRLVELCETRDAVCIVNDRIDVALAAGAHGVHLGPGDLPITDAVDIRSRLGWDRRDFIIGGSAGTPDRARELEAAGADYLGVGAMYDATPSKPDASDPRGPEAITEVRDAVDLPIVGIGGITPDNAPEVIHAGADGVAVIRAICQADHPLEATRALQSAVNGASK